MGQPVNPILQKLPQELVVKGAKGDFVRLVWEFKDKDPRDPSRIYHNHEFDIFRIQNGKIQDHWDDAKKFGPAPVQYRSKAVPPSQWNTSKLSGDERHNLALATGELEDMLQYGHLELADKILYSGYIEHNPNVPQGRDGFNTIHEPRSGPYAAVDQA